MRSESVILFVVSDPSHSSMVVGCHGPDPHPRCFLEAIVEDVCVLESRVAGESEKLPVDVAVEEMIGHAADLRPHWTLKEICDVMKRDSGEIKNR